jgi:hypothetical protein
MARPRITRAVGYGRSHPYVTRAALEEFRRRYIFAEEARCLLGSSHDTLRSYVARGLLRQFRPAHSRRLLFMRAEVVTLRGTKNMA